MYKNFCVKDETEKRKTGLKDVRVVGHSAGDPGSRGHAGQRVSDVAVTAIR